MDDNPGSSSAPFGQEGIDEFSKRVLSALMGAIKASATLPSAGDDYDLYSSFSGFRAFNLQQGSRIVDTINSFLKHQGLKQLSSSASAGSIGIDDKFDCIMDANDTMLEQVGVLLDQFQSQKNGNDTTSLSPTVADNRQGVASKPVVSSWNRRNRYGKQQTFRLFHAHNIPRPQLKFKDKVDNSNVPFVPKIQEKPNAIKPLPQALVDLHKDESSQDISLAIASLVRQGRNYAAEDQNIYDHPYESELDALEYLDEQLMKVDPEKYDPFPSDPCELIVTKEELLQVIEHLKTCQEIAVDLEHHSYRSFQGITCLMQVSSRKKDFLIDTLKLREYIHLFNEVFTNPKIVKVFHGADSDIHWLQRDFGVYVVNMFDTGQAARELGLGRYSLDFLLLKYCGIHADKKYQLADWRIRPIPTEMRKYAQEDTHYLLYVYDVMKNTLLDSAENQTSEMGNTRLLNVLSRSKQICLQKYEKYLITPTSHLELYERNRKKQLNANQLEMLRLLFSWRDTIARQEDESTGYVLPKHMLFQIAEIMPREAHGVLACCNPVPPLVRQHVHTIHQLVLEARAKALNKTSKTADQKNVSKVPVPAKPDVETYDDLLTCPHDMSHAHEGTNSTNTFSSKVSCASQSSLFQNKQNHVATNASRLGSKISQNVTWNLFDKFFPQQPDSTRKRTEHNENGDASIENLTLKAMLGPDFVWKLRQLEPIVKQEVAKPLVPYAKKDEPKEEVIVLQGGKRGRQGTQYSFDQRSKKQKLTNLIKSAKNADFKPHVYSESQYNRFK